MSAKHIDVANLYGATPVQCRTNWWRHVPATHGDVPAVHKIGRTTYDRRRDTPIATVHVLLVLRVSRVYHRVEEIFYHTLQL